MTCKINVRASVLISQKGSPLHTADPDISFCLFFYSHKKGHGRDNEFVLLSDILLLNDLSNVRAASFILHSEEYFGQNTSV